MATKLIEYEVKRDIITFGHECYTDCRPCEMDGAEEHFMGEFEYDGKGTIDFENDLKDVAAINEEAEDIVEEKIIEDYLHGMGKVTVEKEKKGKQIAFPHTKPTIVKQTTKSGLFKWTWNFTATEEEYGCELHCKGTVTIATKPKLPSKGRRQIPSKAPHKRAKTS